jgi:hypothetical protein
VPVPAAPTMPFAQQSDGNILVSWTGSLGATGYIVQRSTDGINFSSLATLGLVTSYLDSLPGVGIAYWYNVLAVNGSGDSLASPTVYMIAAPPSEMSLYELRLRSQQCADRPAQSQFITLDEWNSMIHLACYELYDLLIKAEEDLFADQTVIINTNAAAMNYVLPDGYSNYLGGTYPNTAGGTPARAFYKLAGVDLGVNTSNNAWVTLKKFGFIQRNSYVYPNSTSTIYGVYNLRYRMMGNSLNLIPTPAGNQQLRVWYSPKLPQLLQDTDLTNIGYSGWLRYVIVRSAKYALDKEEGSDTSKLDGELAYLKARIEATAADRDEALPDTISEVGQGEDFGGTGWGSNGGGGGGGWVFAPLGILPFFVFNNLVNGTVIDSVDTGKLAVCTAAITICASYGFYFGKRKLGVISSLTKFMSFFRNHVHGIFKRRAQE